MARSLDVRQQKDLTDFVNAVAERAGFETTAEWARASGYPAPNLSNLRRGKAAIDGYNLLRLIQAAAEQAEETDAAGFAVGMVQESIHSRLDELSALVAEALQLLRDAQAEAPRRAAGGRRSPGRAAK